MLCGLCGIGSKTTTKYSNKLVCQDCGNEFLSVSDKIRASTVGAVQAFVIAIVAVIVSFIMFGDGSVLMRIIGLVIGVLCVFGGIAYLKDRSDVQSRGYDASCYNENKK